MDKKYITTAKGLNLRAGPGVEYASLKTLPLGTVVEDLTHQDWCPITGGWVHRGYLAAHEGQPTGREVVSKAMSQTGDPYVFGVEIDLNNPDPKAFDCSELVEWVCHQLKVFPTMPDGAIYQRNHCQKHNTMIPLAQAVKIPGALLFRIQSDGNNHVVISRGDGSTIEAKGKAYGVGVFSLNTKNFTHAALIPGVVY